MQHRSQTRKPVFYNQLENDMQTAYQIALSLNIVSNDWFETDLFKMAFIIIVSGRI